jgi:hypothetical protein
MISPKFAYLNCTNFKLSVIHSRNPAFLAYHRKIYIKTAAKKALKDACREENEKLHSWAFLSAPHQECKAK